MDEVLVDFVEFEGNVGVVLGRVAVLHLRIMLDEYGQPMK